MGMEQIIMSLRNLGFYDVILPWLFAYVLVYYFAGLIFKGKDKKIKAVPPIIGIVIASYLVAYTPYGTTLSSFFTQMFGDYTIVMAGLLVLLIIVALVLGAPGDKETIMGKLIDTMFPKKFLGINIQSWIKVLISLFLIGVAVWIYFGSANIRVYTQSISMSQGTWAIILFLAIIGMAIYFVTNSGSQESKDKNQEPQK